MSEAVKQLQDTASNALVNMIDVTVKTMSDVVEFSKQQIPDVIHQLLVWKAMESLLNFILPVLILLVFFTWSYTFWKDIPAQKSRDGDNMAPWIHDDYRSRDGWLNPRYWIRGYIAPVMIIIFALVTLASFNLVWLQIWLAPKVYLIQYAAELVKG